MSTPSTLAAALHDTKERCAATAACAQKRHCAPKWFSAADRRWELSPKIIYFCIGGLFYCFSVFRMKFFRTFLLLDGGQAGFVQAAWNVASFAGVAFWNNTADRTASHKRILVALCIGMAAVFMSSALIVALPRAAWLPVAFAVFSVYGFVSGGVLPLTDYHVLRLLHDVLGADRTHYGRQVLFGTAAYGLVSFALGFLIRAYSAARVIFALMPVLAVLAATAVAVLGFPDRQYDCAALMRERKRRRILSAPGVPVDAQRSSSVPPRALVDGAAQGRPRSSSCSRLGACVDPPSGQICYAAYSDDDEDYAMVASGAKEPEAQSEDNRSVLGVLRTLAQPRFLVFLAVVLAIGVGRQVLSLYLSDYLSETIFLGEEIIGTAYLVSCLFSIIFLASGPFFLRRLGVRPMLVVGLAVLTLRLAAYSWLPAATDANRAQITALAIAFEAMNGISFSFTHTAGVQEASACAPAGWQATFQAAYTCMYVQLPAIFVSALGGIVIRTAGGRALMYGTFLLSMAALVAVLAIAVGMAACRRFHGDAKSCRLP